MDFKGTETVTFDRFVLREECKGLKYVYEKCHTANTKRKQLLSIYFVKKRDSCYTMVRI